MGNRLGSSSTHKLYILKHYIQIVFITTEKVTLIDGWWYFNTKIELYNYPLIVPFDIFGPQEVNYYFPKAKHVKRERVPEKLYLGQWQYSQTCIERSPLEKKGDLIRQVNS
jgi:hypothetical protein